MASEKALKKSSSFRLWGRDRLSAGSTRLARPHPPVGIGRLFDVRIAACSSHLSVRCLRVVPMFFIGADVGLRVFEGYVLYQDERIGMMRRRQPGDLRLVRARVHLQSAIENTSRYGRSNRSTVLATLDHRHDHIFGVIERSKAAKPRDRILLTVGG